MGGSQLKLLKAAISASGVSDTNSRKRKRSTGAILEHKDKRTQKLQEIHEKFNAFDVKVERLKHDVGGRKLKGTMGKPGASKQAAIEQRKKTLLVEYQLKDKAGGLVDRRFGEDDPTMTPEERMLARFTKERQKASKGAMYNLEEEDELTHYGQSLSKLDDFDGIGLGPEDDEDGSGQIDAATVKAAHFGGFSDDEEDEDGPPRKKTKGEVMAEVIAKSKEYKYARQLQREQDENTRHELDADFDSIRGILFSQPDPSASGSNSIPIPLRKEPQTQDKDYDVFVRELAMEKRAQPKDRTKTEEEIALEEKEALEKAERKRLKRMMGQPDTESDDEVEGRKRKRGGDDLDDDFILEEDEFTGIGKGLGTEIPANSDDQSDEDEDENEDEEEEGTSEGTEDEFGPSDEGEEAEEGEFEELLPKIPTKSSGAKSKGKQKELPFTFPCPHSHDEFLDILEDVDDSLVGVVVERIRKLHHPSLGEENKFKLQRLILVLLDHVVYSAGLSPPRIKVIDALIPHLYSLSQAYPLSSAEHFLVKLNLMQQNLTRGLQNPLDLESRTFPGFQELVILRVIGSIWSTSDMKHPIVGPARFLLGSYLGLCRVRSISDVASGLYMCSIFMEYEQLSKRLIPEVVNFLVQSLLLLVPSPYEEAKDVPGYFPLLDFQSSLSTVSDIQIKPKKAKSLDPKPPALVDLLHGKNINEQSKLDLLCLTLELLDQCGEMYKSLDGFIELYQPIFDIITSLDFSKFSSSTKEVVSKILDKLARLLKFSKQSRQPLMLQSHKPIPIATFIPKFDSHNSNYIRNRDPDAERAALAKLKAQHRKEKKGAMRELRKDNRFLAGVQQEKQAAKDKAYKDRMAKVANSLQSERVEQKKEEKIKMREKKRAGKK